MADEVSVAPDANTVVTAEQDGRTLSGVGTTTEVLAEAMERHAPPDEAPAEPSTPSQPSQPQKPTRGQARFAELTKARKDAEERAATLARENAELKARSQSSPSQQQPQQQGPPPQQQPPPQQFTRPKPTEDEVGPGGKYKTYADYVDDLTDWKLEQRLPDVLQSVDTRTRQSIEADRATRNFLGHAESTWAKGRKIYADFDTVRMTGPGAQVPMGQDRLRAIVHHPASEHMQYVIAKDAALAHRLARMSDMEFGMMMASFAPGGAAGSLASTTPSGSVTPPAPVQPVGSGSPTTAPSLADAAKRGDIDAYRAARQKRGR